VAGNISLMQAANRDKNVVMTTHVRKDISFQDVAKKGLKYSDKRRNRWRDIPSSTGHYLTCSLRGPTILSRKSSSPTVWFPALMQLSSMRMVTVFHHSMRMTVQ